MDLSLIRLLDDAIRVFGFGGEDGGVDAVPQADTALCQSLMLLSVYLCLVERMAVWMWCPKLVLRSATL
jgi:hypothetical protein